MAFGIIVERVEREWKSVDKCGKYVVICHVFSEISEHPPLIMGEVVFGVDEKGASCSFDGLFGHNEEMFYSCPKFSCITAEVLSTALFPALLAMVLMHCKNVKVIPRGAGIDTGGRMQNDKSA